jgi:hypothetical protein
VHDFHGTVHLASEPDAALEAKVTVDLNRVLIRSGDHEIGSWPHQDVAVSKVDDAVHMVADGETLVLNLDKADFLLDLLGVDETKSTTRGRKRRRKKPELMPEPPPPAPAGSKSSYVDPEPGTAAFGDLRSKAAASYQDDTKLGNHLAIGLLVASALLLAGAALTWGSVRLLDGDFPVGRLLAGMGGLAGLFGLYLAFFDQRRVTGSAVAIAAGGVTFVVLYFYAREARLGSGFMLALLGSLALIGVGAFGMSNQGAADRPPKGE